jgi:hypothetical protein
MVAVFQLLLLSLLMLWLLRMVVIVEAVRMHYSSFKSYIRFQLLLLIGSGVQSKGASFSTSDRTRLELGNRRELGPDPGATYRLSVCLVPTSTGRRLGALRFQSPAGSAD